MARKYLFRVDILSKKDKHPLESIAYYCGEKQVDIIHSKTYETTTEDKVVWSKILAPEKKTDSQLFSQLPDYLKFRSQKADLISNARNILWKSVNNRENRPDSQFARLFEVAIPHFINEEDSVKLLTSFAKNLVAEGMIVDCSLHNYNKQAPILSILERVKLINTQKSEKSQEMEINQDYTGFLMCTLRDYSGGVFVNKNRDWNKSEKLFNWRASWFILLEEAIRNSNASDNEKNNWLDKFKIYTPYKEEKEPVKEDREFNSPSM